MRSPLVPVSTWTLSIFWQLVVLPGAHTVTDVYSALIAGVAFGPAPTVIVATLPAAPVIVLPPAALVAPELWPLQEHSSNTAAPARNRFVNLMART
jgi:hypothetical protein